MARCRAFIREKQSERGEREGEGAAPSASASARPGGRLGAAAPKLEIAQAFPDAMEHPAFADAAHGLQGSGRVERSRSRDDKPRVRVERSRSRDDKTRDTGKEFVKFPRERAEKEDRPDKLQRDAKRKVRTPSSEDSWSRKPGHSAFGKKSTTTKRRGSSVSPHYRGEFVRKGHATRRKGRDFSASSSCSRRFEERRGKR